MKVNRPTNPEAVRAEGTTEAQRGPRPGRLPRLVRDLSLATLGLSALATVVLWGISERTWWGTVFTFCPRHIFLGPPAVLLLASAVFHRRSIATNLACLALVAGPLMGGRVPFQLFASSEGSDRGLSVVSCNVQEYRPDFAVVLREVLDRHPDIVAFQEAPYEHALCQRCFQGWSTIQEPNLWIGSRYPLHQLAGAHPIRRGYGRVVVSVRIDAPDGPIVLHDVHLDTPRRGLVKLTLHSILNGDGPALLEDATRMRMAEARDVRRYIAQNESALPTLIVGDFNTPTVSNLYRDVWQGFTNAFDEAGFGFGYTAPCSAHSFWFNDAPWVRIDQILADRSWTVDACQIGHSCGSDHRLIWARLARR